MMNVINCSNVMCSDWSSSAHKMVYFFSYRMKNKICIKYRKNPYLFGNAAPEKFKVPRVSDFLVEIQWLRLLHCHTEFLDVAAFE